MWFILLPQWTAQYALTIAIIAMTCINPTGVAGAPTAWERSFDDDNNNSNSSTGRTYLTPSTDVVTSIQTTLSLFSIAYDTQQLSLLSEVFTPTATTNFTGTSAQTGIPAITEFLNSTLLPGGSQHAISTLHVNQTGPCTASVLSYLQAIFFGSSSTQGLVFQNFGYYEDQMVKQEESGKWMVQDRVIHNYGAFGDESVLGASP